MSTWARPKGWPNWRASVTARRLVASAWSAQHPKRKSLMDQTGNPGIVSVPECVDAVLLRIVEAPAFLQVLPRANNHSAPEQGHAKRPMRFKLVPDVLLVVRQSEHLFGKITRRLPFRAYQIVNPQTTQNRKFLRGSLRFAA